MQWFTPAAKIGTSCGEAPLKLAVLVIYEDFKTGLRARQMLDRIVQELEAPVDMEVNLWRLDLLREPALRQQASQETAKADILFVSTHSKLRATLGSWLEEWFRIRSGEPSALAVSLDATAKDTRGSTGEVEALGAAARRAGVDVFLHVGDTETDLESGVKDIHPRARTNAALPHGVP